MVEDDIIIVSVSLTSDDTDLGKRKPKLIPGKTLEHKDEPGGIAILELIVCLLELSPLEAGHPGDKGVAPLQTCS